MKKPSRKLVYALILVAVFLLSYATAFFAISLTPYGRYRARVYSSPQTSSVRYGNSSTAGGEWLDQLLQVNPAPGASNVPRDASIIIDAPRPERVENISLSPYVAIAKENYKIYGGFDPSSVQTVYPAGLLKPNTTYNVTGIVGGGWNGQTNLPSWWTFTTSSGPSQLTYVYPLESYDTWVALTVAILVTSIFSVALFIGKNTRATVLL